jgi:thioredoxin 1
MRRGMWIAALSFLAALAVFVIYGSCFLAEVPELSLLESYAHAADEVPVKGMVTMVDLGAGACIPCKMMAPIVEKLEKVYEGKAAVVFIDVWKDQAQARKFGIRAIPTQIFFNEEGEEIYRHVGFMSEKAIVTQLKKMGVD